MITIRTKLNPVSMTQALKMKTKLVCLTCGEEFECYAANSIDAYVHKHETGHDCFERVADEKQMELAI